MSSGRSASALAVAQKDSAVEAVCEGCGLVSTASASALVSPLALVPGASAATPISAPALVSVWGLVSSLALVSRTSRRRRRYHEARLMPSARQGARLVRLLARYSARLILRPSSRLQPAFRAGLSLPMIVYTYPDTSVRASGRIERRLRDRAKPEPCRPSSGNS